MVFGLCKEQGTSKRTKSGFEPQEENVYGKTRTRHKQSHTRHISGSIPARRGYKDQIRPGGVVILTRLLKK